MSFLVLLGLSVFLYAQDAYDLDWVSSSNQIVVAIDETVRVYDANFNLLKILNEQDNFPVDGLHMELSPNGAYIGVLYSAPETNKGIQIWQLSSEQMILDYPNVSVNDFAWSPDSQRILLHEFDEVNTKYKLNFIDITSGNIIHSIETPLDKGIATTIHWSHENYLALESDTIDLWRVDLANLTQTYIGHWQPNGYAGALTFSPNGLQFAATVENGTSELQIVTAQTLATEFIIPLNERGIKTMWRPDGLFVWQRYGTLSYIEQPSDEEISFSFEVPELRQFTWDFNGTYIFTVNQSGVATIRDATNGNILNTSNLLVVPTPNPTPTSTPSYTCTVSGIATETALKSAIINANGLSTPSVLCLQPNATITMTTLTNGAPDNSNGDSFLPLIQRNITIVGNGSTLTRSSSAVHGRFFRVAGADATLTLDGITLTGGVASGSTKGGAIRVDSRMVSLKNNTIITGNSAEAGGAIYNYLGTVQIENSTLSNNTVGTDGGAIYGIGIFNLTNAIVTENKSSNNGGGMYVFNASGVLSQVTLTDSTFLSNEATNNGGALSMMSGVTLTLNGGFIKTNWAVNWGGGMALTNATATVSTTEFEGNYSTNTQSRGGAIFMTGTDAALTVNAAKFLNNTTKTAGGAIYNASGDINLTGGSFTGNQTQNSGSDGGAIFSANASAELKIQNAKFTSNSALDQGGAVARSNGTGFMSGSCLVTNTAANGAAVYSSNSFTATNNWWNNATPPVNIHVTTNPVTPGTTCPLG